MRNNRNDHDRDRDHDSQTNVPATTGSGGALASLESLGAVLNKVDISTAAGRSGLPMLQFKRDGSGTWQFGQRAIVVEDGSRWAADPRSFRRGYICFDSNNKVVGEHLVSISKPMPDLVDLPDKGPDSKWSEQWAVNLKCVNGSDAGTEVVYKPTTVGGIQAVTGLIEAIREQINSGQHGGKVAPILHLNKDSYQHPQFGRVWVPMLSVVDWMPLDGPAPLAAKPPPPTPPAAEQPRRRRVA